MMSAPSPTALAISATRVAAPVTPTTSIATPTSALRITAPVLRGSTFHFRRLLAILGILRLVCLFRLRLRIE
ncbi:hypothetical protein C1Y09_31185, partial [Pseudomonas sp. FW306-02-F08-AA]